VTTTQVKIEKLVYGGDGLAHHDGQAVFVPFVLPEEVVAIRPLEKKKTYLRGRLEQVVVASAERATPPCKHFTVCGGCHYQHMPYETQLRYKTDILRETLRRLGRMDWPGPIHVHPSPPVGYRNRAQWKLRPLAQGLRIGYHQSGTAALCAVEHCPILAPHLENLLLQLCELLAQSALPATVREIEAFVNRQSSATLVNASFSAFEKSPQAVAEVFRKLPGVESVLLHESAQERFELFGPGYIHCELSGTRYRVGHLSFFQVNDYMLEQLVAAVTAGEEGREALDLYAGVGLFSVPLARRFEELYAVEANPAAARDLEANLSSAPSARAVAGEVRRFLSGWTDSPDLVLLDPPRAGLEREVAERLVALRPSRITYLSCDPSTLARDLAVLTRDRTYQIAELHLFDLFPQTFHIESLVKLERRS